MTTPASPLRATTYCHEILPGVFLGSQEAFELELPLLASEFNVRGVIRCLPAVDHCSEANERENARVRATLEAAKLALASSASLSAALLVVPIYDDEEEDIFQHFAATTAFIEKRVAAGEAVLVHCRAGVSRSAAVVCAYVAKALRLDVEAALDLCRARRSQVCPNSGFLRGLVEWQRHALGSASVLDVALVTRWCFRFPRSTFADLRGAWTEACRVQAENAAAAAADTTTDDTADPATSAADAATAAALRQLPVEARRKLAREIIFERALSSARPNFRGAPPSE